MTRERKNEIWAMLDADTQEWIKGLYRKGVPYENFQFEPIERIRLEQFCIAVGGLEMLEFLFGKHNLTAQAEEKPKEPSFKVGDKVIAGYSLRIVLKINQVENIYRYFIVDVNGEASWYDEDELTPYTESKEYETKKKSPSEQISQFVANCDI